MSGPFCQSCWNYLDACDCVWKYKHIYSLASAYRASPVPSEDKGPCVSIWPHGMRHRSRSVAETGSTNLAIPGTDEVWQTRRYDWIDGLPSTAGGTEYWPHTHYNELLKKHLFVAEVVMKFADGSIDYSICYFKRPPTMDDVRHAIATGAWVAKYDTIEDRNEAVPYKDEGGKNQGEEVWKGSGIYQGLYGDRIIGSSGGGNPEKDPEDETDDDMSTSSETFEERIPPDVDPEDPPAIDLELEMTVVTWSLATLPLQTIGEASTQQIGVVLMRRNNSNFPVFTGPYDTKVLEKNLDTAIMVKNGLVAGDTGRIGVLTFVPDQASLVERHLDFEDPNGAAADYILHMNGQRIESHPDGNHRYSYTPTVVGMSVHVIELELFQESSFNTNTFLRLKPDSEPVWWPVQTTQRVEPNNQWMWDGPPVGVPVQAEPNFTILTHVPNNKDKYRTELTTDEAIFCSYILYGGHVRSDRVDGLYRLSSTTDIGDTANVWNIAFPELFEKGTVNPVPTRLLGNYNLDTTVQKIQVRNSQGNLGRSIGYLHLHGVYRPPVYPESNLSILNDSP